MTTPSVSSRVQRQFLKSLFAHVLDRSDVETNADFFDLGGDDEKADQVLDRIRREWGIDVPGGTLRRHPTITGLLAYVSEQHPTPDPKVVLPLRRLGGQLPLFCIHPGSGFGLPYMGLVPHLEADIPVFALQARGLVGAAELPSSLDEMAQDYLAQIRRVQAHGPYRLLGWCLGGRVAFEVACLLRDLGEEVETLTLLSAFPPDGDPAPEPEQSLRNMLMPPTAVEMDPELDRLCRLPLNHAALKEYLDRTGHPMRRLNERSLPGVFAIYQNNERLIREPVRRRYDGSLLCMVSVEHSPADATAAWRPYVNGAIDIQEIACRHSEMMEPGPLQDIGAAVAAGLAAHSSSSRENADV